MPSDERAIVGKHALTRRAFCGCASALGAGLASRALGQEQAEPGCIVLGGAEGASGLPADSLGLSREAGDWLVSSGMPHVLSEVLPLFKIEVDFAEKVFFYDDDDRGNAEVRTGSGINEPSLVLIGRNLIGWTKRVDATQFGVGLSSIIAHEFAHVYQMRTTHYDELSAAENTMRRIELHADFLAGWALPRLGWISGSVRELAAAANQLFAMGDHYFDKRDHHGTRQQRFAAISSGFIWGMDKKSDLDTAAAYGRDFLKGLL